MDHGENNNQPLLAASSSPEEHRHDISAATAIFSADSPDIPPINTPKDFFTQFLIESKKLWYLAAPAIFTSISQYSLGAITQVLAGHVGALQLAAFSVENSVIAGFCFGFMLGMGSALETLCGQAYGAGQLDMLGIYMQRSWVILNSTALILTPLYIFARQILKAIGQKTAIADAAGLFALWMIPQLFAYAMNFPIQKFLQAQSRIMAMAWISAAVLVVHTVMSWLLMLKLKWGLVGAAVVLNSSWWLVVLGQLVYIFTGTCGRAWSGFSFQAFKNLWSFLRLSLASAVMLCLEVWYFTALILFAGYLKNAEVSVDALSICINILGWTIMVSFGLNATVSVRVSNELGAGHPRAAKFSLLVAVMTSLMLGIVLALILIIFRNEYPSLFSSDKEVQEAVKNLTPMLAFCIVINNVQPVLSGIAVGAGWQAIVAYVNIACYYLFGIPLALLLGFKFDLGVIGIWSGMLSGTILQTIVLTIMVWKTNWNKEASLAEDRIKKWGGHADSGESETGKTEET
ncbi:protein DETOXIFICATION 29-like [Prosopis cineraria]|uniref:protein DETOXIFICATION 29-like n=1 Tax=Prosopis cineraria TaxID=364024 RepID=UPI0024107A94|nr:protein DETOXIFICATION 29-like [Prosopis cineraria]XP_054823288.1 protein DETOXIFICATION 29-like [Prosopis cineraria]